MKHELLAPAGNIEAGYAALYYGADAVYLGLNKFSARANADNFTFEELNEFTAYAHHLKRRVFVALNTILSDGEIDELPATFAALNKAKVDGLIVQDLGVVYLAKKFLPNIELHASTQMAIHHRTGVDWCVRHGIRRVVLARECALSEIRRCAGAGAEIEVFVHGAQCVAVSGMCLFSSMLGERSGNRGRCAQPCRMEYLYRGRKGAWLSPRDLCLRDELPALREAGVDAVKIEGRLKRPEYVAVVTDSYRKGLDSLAMGSFQPADEKEKTDLLQIFNRGGFMKGYAMGCEDAAVIFPDSVHHQGVRMGVITEVKGKLARFRPERTLRNGDGLVIRGADGESGMVS